MNTIRSVLESLLEKELSEEFISSHGVGGVFLRKLLNDGKVESIEITREDLERFSLHVYRKQNLQELTIGDTLWEDRDRGTLLNQEMCLTLLGIRRVMLMLEALSPVSEDTLSMLKSGVEDSAGFQALVFDYLINCAREATFVFKKLLETPGEASIRRSLEIQNEIWRLWKVNHLRDDD